MVSYAGMYDCEASSHRNADHTKPSGDQYGKGLTREFARIFKDFYNGALGDSTVPTYDILNIVASIFLFTPYNIAQSKTLYNANLKGKLCFQRR